MGSRIRAARIAAGMATQRELAAAIGAQQEQVSRYETGKKRPNIDTLARIAEATGHRMMWLATGNGPRLEQGAA